jgi:hypothetical protein
MANETFAVHLKWDEAGLTSYVKFLDAHQAKALEKLIDKAMGKALRPLVGKEKSSEQRSGITNRSGKLLRSIGIRKPRKRAGEVVAYTIGPNPKVAPHAHLVIPGHEEHGHKPAKRDLGMHTRAFPFVDPVIDAEARQLQAQLSSDVWASSIKPL